MEASESAATPTSPAYSTLSTSFKAGSVESCRVAQVVADARAAIETARNRERVWCVYWNLPTLGDAMGFPELLDRFLALYPLGSRGAAIAFRLDDRTAEVAAWSSEPGAILRAGRVRFRAFLQLAALAGGGRCVVDTEYRRTDLYRRFGFVEESPNRWIMTLPIAT